MKWQKAPEDLKRVLDSAMQGIECEKRPMFGYPAYFINRNMFIGLFQDQLFMRLSESTLSALKGKSIAVRNLEPMPGRPMKDYFVIPRELLRSPPDLRHLVEEAAQYARTLKPKPSKAAPKARSKKTVEKQREKPKRKP